VEGIGHAESDGIENYGNERNFHIQYAKVGYIKGDLQGSVAWCRSLKR
jgi:hypothetical protein